MKKYCIIFLAFVLLFGVVSCGADPDEMMPVWGPAWGGETTPTDTLPVVTTPAPTTFADHACTTPVPTEPPVTSSWDGVPPLTNQVELLDGEGKLLDTYSELIWIMDGSLIGDGLLMFQTVPNRLPAIADQIPLVDLVETPTVRIIIKDTETARGGEAISVYGEDYTQLAQRITWEEVLSRGKTEWKGRLLYLYFSVNYDSTYSPDYTKSMSTAYFVKTIFE